MLFIFFIMFLLKRSSAYVSQKHLFWEYFTGSRFDPSLDGLWIGFLEIALAFVTLKLPFMCFSNNQLFLE